MASHHHGLHSLRGRNQLVKSLQFDPAYFEIECFAHKYLLWQVIAAINL